MGRETVATAYYVNVCIGGVSFEALVDTGSAVTLMSKAVYDRIPGDGILSVDNKSDCAIQGILGAAAKISTIASVKLQLGPFCSEGHPVWVAEDSYQPFILGMDFLDRYGIGIQTAGRTLTIGKYPNIVEVPLRVAGLPMAGDFRVVSRCQVIVPPRSRRMVDVKVRNLRHDIDGCIEPMDKAEQGVLVARSVNSVHDGYTGIECINLNSYPVTVQKHQALATFTPVEMVQCPIEPNEACSGESRDVSELFQLGQTGLSLEQREQAVELLNRYHRVVSEGEHSLGHTSTIKHTIDVQGSDPIKQPYRRFPLPMKQEINKEIEQMLRQGVIEPSASPWAAPLVPVRKKSGSLRLCIDFRALNEVTRKDSFPLPNIADAVGQFIDNEYFSSLDLMAGYHQIEVEESSREKTAFSTGDNLYQFRRMPFGVTNGPATFSRLVAIVLSGIPFDVAQAYLDDIIVAGKSFEEHLGNLETVFQRLELHGLKLNPAKCQLFRSEVSYLGHIVSKDGIRPLADNIQAIVECPVPSTVKGLRSFNGLVNFYKKFIQDSEEIMKPLYRATSGKRLNWTEECQTAFEQVKDRLTKAPVLGYPNFESDEPFYVTTDASGVGAGAVLSQFQRGEEKTLGYAGTAFNQAQLRYSPTDRELAAIRFAVNHFKPYLYGRRYVIRTDHQPLVYLHHMRRFDDRLHRTLEDLNIGHYEFEYLPGKSNIAADALSRMNYPWVLKEEGEYPIGKEAVVNLGDYRKVCVPGGPDSLFCCVSTVLFDSSSRSGDVREAAVEAMLKNPERYKFKKGAVGSKQIELLRETDTFPPMSMLQAVSDSFGIEVMVHHTSGPTITVRPKGFRKQKMVVLCSGGVHFDLLTEVNGPATRVKSMATDSHVVVGNCLAIQQTSGGLSLDSGGEQVRKAQEDDRELAMLKAAVEKGRRPSRRSSLSKYRSWFKRLSVTSEGVLVAKKTEESAPVPLAPTESLTELATQLHEVTSHAGRSKMVDLMARRFAHPYMYSVVRKRVRECVVCQLHKGNVVKDFPVWRRNVETVGEVYAVDLLDMPRSKRGYKALLVGLDLKSKYGHAIPLKSKKSLAVARALEAHVLATIPVTIHTVLSDNGPEFRGKPFTELLRRYGIKSSYSVPYRPQTNGAVERLNRTLKQKLATVCHGRTRYWDREIHQVMAQYNRMPHQETGKSPLEFFSKAPAELILPGPPTKTWKDAVGYEGFQVGDLVLRKTPYQPVGERDKLSPRYQGPLEVNQRDPNGVTYRAKWLQGRKRVVQLHVSQMKKFHGDGLVDKDHSVTSSDRESSEGEPRKGRTPPGPLRRAGAYGINWELVTSLPGIPGGSPDGDNLPTNLSGAVGSWEVSQADEREVFHGDYVNSSGVISSGCSRIESNLQASVWSNRVVSDDREVRESTPVPGRRHGDLSNQQVSPVPFEVDSSDDSSFYGFQEESLPSEFRGREGISVPTSLTALGPESHTGWSYSPLVRVILGSSDSLFMNGCASYQLGPPKELIPRAEEWGVANGEIGHKDKGMRDSRGEPPALCGLPSTDDHELSISVNDSGGVGSGSIAQIGGRNSRGEPPVLCGLPSTNGHESSIDVSGSGGVGSGSSTQFDTRDSRGEPPVLCGLPSTDGHESSISVDDSGGVGVGLAGENSGIPDEQDREVSTSEKDTSECVSCCKCRMS